jgi:acyl transferase domain-containing protein
MSDNEQIEGIAVVGMAGRFSKAANVEQFWANLAAGKDCFDEFSVDHIVNEGVPREIAERPDYVRRASVIADPGSFDNWLFSISPKEAELIDPQQRILLECAWEALENAGHDPKRFQGLIGIWAGSGVNNYFLKNIIPRGSFDTNVGFQEIISNDKDYLASRIAYKLGLRGPAVVVQSACSTSIVAVNMACLALLTYQCDVALAGAVFLQTPRARGYIYREGEIFSPDGFCRPFDKGANGTLLGEGCGLVVLRRLEEAIADGDNILAVIRGSAVNNDGADRAGYTAPGVAGQMELLGMAHTVAGVKAEDISYIEAHGTGTRLGDPIEVTALTQIFRRTTAEQGFCGIGSVKSNIGHLDVAAGIAGLIKTICALQHRQLPPTINFTAPNPELRISESPFYVVDKLTGWQPRHGHRIAGVSSFGMGGTNGHVILEEAPLIEPSGESRPWQLLILSAKKESTLETMCQQLGRHLEAHPDKKLADIAFTLQTGRQELNYRRYLVCHDVDDAIKKLNSPNKSNIFSQKTERSNPAIAFMFPGQGSQYVNMGLNLYKHEPEFRETVDYCAETLMPFLGIDLRDILYPKDGDLKDTEELLKKTGFQQPAMFTIEYALARLWMQWGVKPSAMIGHSIGEYVAACLADVFSLKDALMLVANRGRMMQDLPGGSMLSVRLPAREVESKLPPVLSLAVVNAPSLCVVSGPSDSIALFQKALEAEGVTSRLLQTSHAFHSPMMETIVKPFSALVESTVPASPKIPFVSTATGAWITPEQASDPMYWGRQLRLAVRFAEGVKTLWDTSDYVLLEVGPRTTAATLARQQIKDKTKQKAIATLSDTSEDEAEWKAVMSAVGDLWLAGVQVSWKDFYKHERRHRLPLPAYPFERKRYWIETPREFYQDAKEGVPSENPAEEGDSKYKIIEAAEQVDQNKISSSTPDSTHTEAENLLADVWQAVLGVDKEMVYNNYFRDLGGDSLSVLKVIATIKKKTGITLTPFLIMLNTIENIAPYLEQGSSLSEQEITEGDGTKDKASVKQKRAESYNIMPFYFGDPQKRLCGIYHPPPDQVDRNEGVLLCHPLPQEYMHCYWSLRELSDLLSNAGFHVLRFDYFGTGDSAGETNEVDINQWRYDILSAGTELKNRSKVDRISLIGLRFGATLAYQASSNNGFHFNKLVLWDPVLNGEGHVKELDKMQDELILNQKPHLQKSLLTREHDELIGYPFPSQHRASIKEVDLFNNPFPAVEKIVILSSQDKDENRKFNDYLSSNGLTVHHHVVKDLSSWGELTSVMDVQFPSKILHEIVTALRQED